MLLRMLLIAPCLIILSAIANAAQYDVPERFQGEWVAGGTACDAGGEKIVISATSVIFPDGRYADLSFDADANVIRMRDEGRKAEYVVQDDHLIFHPEGAGTGSAFHMTRCRERGIQAERRCGWLANLRQGDWWLVDRDQTWILSRKGDDDPRTTALMDRVPRFDSDQLVSVGDYYGYGCACLNVVTEPTSARIAAIVSSRRLPLAACEADKTLPAFGNW